MRSVLLIGMGAGDPDHVTVGAVEALNRADVLFVPDKGSDQDDLRRIRHDICRRFLRHDRTRVVEFAALRRRADVDSYRGTVAEWHGRLAEQYEALFADHLAEGETGGFLVWGDPSLYDSTLRVIEAVRARGRIAVEHAVIPGITSVQALAARHRIVLNDIGDAVRITTGRRLAIEGIADGETTVVMLDGAQAFAALERDDLDIFWGAYLGTPDEILLSGPLPAVAPAILAARAEARRRKGWIMDTYLLRRRKAE